ncbi:MAG: glycosyltransferase [Oligoflexia bacterium]|nr:glycosyltransferase [Oligoflexia bacterium]
MEDIVAFATAGNGSPDEARLQALVAGLEPRLLRFNHGNKGDSFVSILKTLRDERPRLACMEGTGIAGGGAAILGKLFYGVPYVVSSGDAVGPFVGAREPLASPFFWLYELLLCRLSSGFIGWTPYLTGRALAFGAPRAITVPGWAPLVLSAEERAGARTELRARLGIPAEAIVIGIAGSLQWNSRRRYVYGLELVRALAKVRRADVHAIIVGDGTGLERLRREAGALADKRIHFPGRVAREEVPRWLAAMDLGSLPQSRDQVGSYRYSTKLPEYLAHALPVVTGRLPFAYDLDTADSSWLWRLPGHAPWDPRYVDALAQLLDSVTREELSTRGASSARVAGAFAREPQLARAAHFFRELLSELA